MPPQRNISASAARAISVAIGLVEQQEERLRDILESKQATPDEKFAALVDLARLAGILLHKVAEDQEAWLFGALTAKEINHTHSTPKYK
jgi:hypothetical protein